MDTISPELALIDEGLRASGRRQTEAAQVDPTARSRICEGTLHAPRTPEIEREAARPLGTTPRSQCDRGRRARAVGVPVAIALSTLGLVGMNVVDASAPRGPAADSAATRTSPEARRGGLQRDLELRWRPLPRAAFYNVILWRNGGRALDLWPKKAVVDLSGTSIRPGVYDWFVIPALTTEHGYRYGRVIARGRVRI